MPKHENKKTSRLMTAARNVAATTGVALISVGTAFAEEAGGSYSIDLTAAVTGVAIIAGLMAAGSLKAVPTYAGWGIRKALSMLR